jgi:hypothetical protein
LCHIEGKKKCIGAAATKAGGYRKGMAELLLLSLILAQRLHPGWIVKT